MAIAGKVAITPKGEWNAQTAYTKLDLVFYENASYVAIQPSTGVEPTNESYWMLMVQSAGGADLEAIISGTTQVGNAKTLDGHGAEYFATVEGLFSNVKSYNNMDFNTIVETSIYGSSSKPSGVGATNYPEDATGILITHASKVIAQKYITVYGVIYERSKWYNSETWENWKQTATTADLANYLPLTGGTVKTPNRRAMNVSNTGGADVSIGYRHGDTLLGEIGVKDSGAYYIDSSNKVNTILHTGNKPTGTYTGNGDATQRIINTGGTGKACLVWSDNGTALISFTGSLLYASSGVNALGGDGATFRNNNILLYTTDNKLNANGVTYNYQVL